MCRCGSVLLCGLGAECKASYVFVSKNLCTVRLTRILRLVRGILGIRNQMTCNVGRAGFDFYCKKCPRLRQLHYCPLLIHRFMSLARPCFGWVLYRLLVYVSFYWFISGMSVTECRCAILTGHGPFSC